MKLADFGGEEKAQGGIEPTKARRGGAQGAQWKGIGARLQVRERDMALT